MYTPLPLLPGIDPADGITPLPAPGAPYNTVPNLQAQMCIVQFGAGFTTFIDIGDAYHAP